MAKNKKKNSLFGGISIRRDSDILEVRIRDLYFNRFYEGKANINDPKDMKRLISELKDKGVPL